MVHVRLERLGAIAVFLAFLAITTSPAQADIYKCRAADGRVQFSDTQCEAGRTESVLPDRQTVNEVQVAGTQPQMDSQAGDERAAVLRIGESPQPAERTPVAKTDDSSKDADTVSRCVRDVERQAASENVKAEMIAACRTAPAQQRTSGQSSDTVSDCVRSVERTGALGNEKARQIALCHGGDVQPEYRLRR